MWWIKPLPGFAGTGQIMRRFASIGRHSHSRNYRLPARLQSHQPQVTGAQNDGSARAPLGNRRKA